MLATPSGISNLRFQAATQLFAPALRKSPQVAPETRVATRFRRKNRLGIIFPYCQLGPRTIFPQYRPYKTACVIREIYRHVYKTRARRARNEKLPCVIDCGEFAYSDAGGTSSSRRHFLPRFHIFYSLRYSQIDIYLWNIKFFKKCTEQFRKIFFIKLYKLAKYLIAFFLYLKEWNASILIILNENIECSFKKFLKCFVFFFLN